MTTTKRHPSRIRARSRRDARRASDGDGFLRRFQHRRLCLVGADGRQSRARSRLRALSTFPIIGRGARAVHTHLVPAGAFRGFGVPQSALAQEQLFDELARKARSRPAGVPHPQRTAGRPTDRHRPGVRRWRRLQGAAWRRCVRVGAPRAPRRRRSTPPRAARCGAASASPACGTAAAIRRCRTPRRSALGLKADGRVALFQGAVDIGQGSNTVIPQICADALGAPIERLDFIGADTDLSPDGGKTSASRQTFVSGNAALLAGAAMRREILRLANAGEDAALAFEDGALRHQRRRRRAAHRTRATSRSTPPASSSNVDETYDPPTTTLDANGQGDPYAVFG